MAALIADREVVRIGGSTTIKLPMAVSTTIYKGSLVSIVTATGLAVPSSDTAAYPFFGIAREGKVSAATGTEYIKVETNGIFRIPSTLTVAVTHLGVKVFVIDSGNVTNAAGATNDQPVGIIVNVHSTGAGGLVDVYLSPGGAVGAGGSA